MVPAVSYRASPTPQYSGYCYVHDSYVYRAITFYGQTFQTCSTWNHESMLQSYNPTETSFYGLGYSLFARHYLGNLWIDFFSSGYLDVSVLRVCSHCWVTCLQHAGLPHSDICGSIRVCQSPQLFAAYHVLRRLWKPRHPPYALNDFFPNIILVYFYTRHSKVLGYLFVMSLSLMSMIYCSS